MIWALNEEVISVRPAASCNYENSQRFLIKFGMRRCLNNSLLSEFNSGPLFQHPLQLKPKSIEGTLRRI
jgi:hypothetical protein